MPRLKWQINKQALSFVTREREGRREKTRKRSLNEVLKECDLAKRFFTSKFGYLLFFPPTPTHQN
jgi:hypothetical protein